MLDAMLMQEISLAIFLFGLVYVFGTYVLGRVIASMDHDHDVDKGLDKDLGKDFDKDFDKGFDKDFDKSFDKDFDKSIDKGFDKDFDKDIKEWEKGIEEPEMELDHDLELDLETDIEGVVGEIVVDDGGYFEADAGIPISITIGTFLISFGFIGMVLYSNEIVYEMLTKLGIHVLLTLGVFLLVRGIISKLFKETGFYITYGDMIGHRVLAMSTVSRVFGEVRGRTDMGLRRFHARPANAATIYEKGLELYVVAAVKRLLYVHHLPEVSDKELEKLMSDYTEVDGKKIFFRKRVVAECSYCSHLNDSESLSCKNCGGPLERLVAMKFLKEEVSGLEHA